MELKAHKYRSLDALPAYYQRLFEETSTSEFFLSLPWFVNLERTIVSDEEGVLVYGIEPTDISDHILGVLPLWKRSSSGVFGPRILQSLSNYYTPYFSPVLNGAHANEAVRALAAALWADRRLFDAIDLRCLDPMSPVFPSLVRSLAEVGLVVQTYFLHGNWYLDVGGRSYTDYFTSLPSVLKKNIPYQTRRLERTYRIDIKLVTGKDGLEQALNDYETVYNSSWRDQEGYPSFIRGLAETAVRSGSLRLALLYADGVPAAAQLWLVHGGIASIYKIAYDEKFAKLSIGTVLTAHMMRHVIDIDKVTIVDYLSGDDSYKKDWMSHRRERWGILALNPRSVNGFLQVMRHIGGRFIRKMAQGRCGLASPSEQSGSNLGGQGDCRRRDQQSS